jgi:hypothetical protein
VFDNLDIKSVLLVAALTLIPATIVFTIATVMRVRRSSFRRQRITSHEKKSSSSKKS